MTKYAMSADEVIAWIRGAIRSILGNEIEDRSHVYASHGWFVIEVLRCKPLRLRREELPKFWQRLRIAGSE